MEKDKKELTPEQIRQRKKLLVMPLFGLIFLGCLYWIFVPSDKAETGTGINGYNANVPAAQNGELVDKKKAYDDQQLIQAENERMQTLNDFALLTVKADSTKTDADFSLKIEPETDKRPPSSVEHSGIAYQNMANELNSFYNTSATDNRKEKELERRIEELTEKLSEKENVNPVEQQMAIMEKSYQMAAKYLTPQQQAEQKPVEIQPAGTIMKKPKAAPITPVSENVVSALRQPITDSAFISRMQQNRNLGFVTVGVQSDQRAKNSIRACVLSDQTIISGQAIKLRLLEALKIGNTIIPINTELTGESTLQGERLAVTVTAIQYQGNIYPVELTAYDLDGIKGIHAPGSIETDAAKEAVANIGGSLGQNITINRNAGQQVVSDLTRGALQAGSQYIGLKARQVKIYVKANYEVLLLPKQDY